MFFGDVQKVLMDPNNQVLKNPTNFIKVNISVNDQKKECYIYINVPL